MSTIAFSVDFSFVDDIVAVAVGSLERVLAAGLLGCLAPGRS